MGETRERSREEEKNIALYSCVCICVQKKPDDFTARPYVTPAAAAAAAVRLGRTREKETDGGMCSTFTL